MGKNAIVGQSGGPTSVINASLAGVFESCKNRAETVHLLSDKLKTTSSDNDLTALVRATAHHKSSSVSIHTPGHRHPRQNPDL